ncbi:MAG: MFS transporter [Chloroflexota bacterium]|nr:MFS transporter [Chloroflexota bacterium]
MSPLRFTSLRAVSLAHFSVDLLNSLGAVVFTFMSAHLLSLTKTQIGLAASLYALVGSLSQPLFGYLADKNGGRSLGVWSMVWLPVLLMTAYFVGAATGSFELMLAFYVVASLGSAAFHPMGALHASGGDKTRAARNLSYFFLAGQLGLALGPLLVGWMLAQTLAITPDGSLLPLLIFTPLVLPGMWAMQRSLPGEAQYTEARQRDASASSGKLTIPVKLLLFLAAVVALRSLSTPGAAPFIPIMFEAKGWTPESYGFITSMYWLATALSPLLASRLSERFGSRAVIGATLLLGAPMFWFLPQSDGIVAVLLALLGGGLTGASHSIIVAEGQRIMPSGKGFASGAVMGFIFGTGALGSLIIGALSDSVGITIAFEIVAVVTVVAAVLGWLLPDSTPARTAAPVAQPAPAPSGD